MTTRLLDDKHLAEAFTVDGIIQPDLEGVADSDGVNSGDHFTVDPTRRGARGREIVACHKRAV